MLDPLGTGIYLVCGVPEAKDVFREERSRRLEVTQRWGVNRVAHATNAELGSAPASRR